MQAHQPIRKMGLTSFDFWGLHRDGNCRLREQGPGNGAHQQRKQHAQQ
jgi:hypothetical protein